MNIFATPFDTSAKLSNSSQTPHSKTQRWHPEAVSEAAVASLPVDEAAAAISPRAEVRFLFAQ
jgi:hypothetical protein